MKMNLYTIYDVKAKESGPVFEAKNDDVAWRKCKMEFRGVSDLSDFILYCLGEYDSESVGIEPDVVSLGSLSILNEEKKDK